MNPLLCIAITWALISIYIIVDLIDDLQEISLPKQFLATILLIIFTPVVLLSNLFVSAMDLLLPEGWNDDAERH